MNEKVSSKSLNIGQSELTLETGKMARQADGAISVRYGDTHVFVAAVSEEEPSEERDYLPLFVEYREYTYAAGKIPGGFFKREGKPSEKETLTARLIDRPIRPLFPDGFRCETQVNGLVLSADQKNNPDVLGVTGAATALYVSDIPFTNPIAAVRVGRVEDEFVVNPTYEMLEESDLNLVVAAGEESVMMVEADSDRIDEETFMEAVEFGHGEIKSIIEVQKEMNREMGDKNRTTKPFRLDEDIKKEVNRQVYTELSEAVKIPGKLERGDRIDEIKEELLEDLSEEELEEKGEDYEKAFDEVHKQVVRDYVLKKDVRPDGRDMDEIRPLSCEVGTLSRTHGSALFTRGETQALVTTTLGTPSDAQVVDALEGESSKRFMLHYNFPPFCVGEIWPVRGPKRREIGHGVLAEKALKPLLPEEDDFAYTMRMVSDIMESNGSSSMASVCGGSLALFDAGVPVDEAVAGIAMGLMMDDNGDYAILSDIAGSEDHFGDMDFKIAGTKEGITAIQMDIKIEGLSFEVMEEALMQAKDARSRVLGEMRNAISEPRPELSPHAPKMVKIEIDKDNIRNVIGPGGKMIRSIIDRTDTQIDIDDDGIVHISGDNSEDVDKAIDIIRNLTAEPEVGKTYLGTVKTIKDYGAFVEILPGKDGLLHISEIADYHVNETSDELEEGQEVLVKIINIDDKDRIKLSKKAASEEADV